MRSPSDDPRVAKFVRAVFPRAFRSESGGRELTVPCPFCPDPPGKRHLSINASSGLWICFKCGEGGSFRRLVREIARRDPSLDPDDYLGEDPASPPRVVPVVRSQTPPSGGTPVGVYPIWTPRADSPIVERARLRGLRYVEERGVENAEFYRVHVGVGGRYDGRILVPVVDPVSLRPFGWVARAFRVGMEPKVLNTPSEGGRSVDEVPFGLDRARGVLKEVVLVEGIFDAMKHGPSFLALLGKRATEGQFAAIVGSGFARVTVLLDADAEREGKALARSLRMHVPDVRWAVVPGHKDPGDAPREVVRAAVRAAVRV